MMTTLTAAQLARAFYLNLLGAPDHPDVDLTLAVQQTRDQREEYKAPHALRGTAPRPRRPRLGFNKKLFKGHRV
jgi:hypothetical protein